MKKKNLDEIIEMFDELWESTYDSDKLNLLEHCHEKLKDASMVICKEDPFAAKYFDNAIKSIFIEKATWWSNVEGEV